MLSEKAQPRRGLCRGDFGIWDAGVIHRGHGIAATQFALMYGGCLARGVIINVYGSNA